MKRPLRWSVLGGLLWAVPSVMAWAGDGGAPAVPITRDDLKQALEKSKHNQPRLPLPPLTDTEKTQIKQPAGGSTGRLGVVNNGRMRRHYLPTAAVSGGFSREPDSAMTLGYPFQTRLFWIVSRGNNCTYCMGHQEVKLADAGMTEDQIAALDGDWSDATPQEQAAYAFTRKITFTPEAIGDADVAALRAAGLTDPQILEIILVDSNFNAMNRWTGALRIPQEEHRDYSAPTPEKYRGVRGLAAPLTNGTDPVASPSRRPRLETQAEVASALEACRARKPRLPLVDESAARQTMGGQAPESGTVPTWQRLLATFPKAGPQRAGMFRAAQGETELDARTKAVIAYVAARHDRAWYALGHAIDRLKAVGLSTADIEELDAQSEPINATEMHLILDRAANAPSATRVVASFARKLTTDPARIDDADVESLRRYFSDKATAEVVHNVAEAAFFDRLTEASGLPLEPETAR